LPDGFGDGFHHFTVKASLTGPDLKNVYYTTPDVDVAFFSRECKLVGVSTASGDESGFIPHFAHYLVSEEFNGSGPLLVRVDANDG
jgi:hypothetical protein